MHRWCKKSLTDPELKTKIEVNILKLQHCSVMLLKSMACLLIAGMVLTGCAQRQNDQASESPAVDAIPVHDSTTPVTNDSGAMPVINRPHYHTVEIKQMKFNPQELVVSKGDTVVWVNNGITAHDVTAQPEAKWTSSSMPVGGSWQMIVNESSDYYCSIHVVMKGKLVMK